MFRIDIENDHQKVVSMKFSNDEILKDDAFGKIIAPMMKHAEDAMVIKVEYEEWSF